MLQLNYIRENREEVLTRLAKRNFKDAESLIGRIIELDTNRKSTQKLTDDARAEGNVLAKQIGELMRTGKKEEAEVAKKRTGDLKNREKELDEQLKKIEEEIHQVLVTVPNVPYKDVKSGKSADDNEVVFEHGQKPSLHATAKPHWELADTYDLIDFELGVKLTGAGFPVYKGKGARLQRALINFFLDKAIAQGYMEIQPPFMVNEASGFGTGQLPDKEGQMYHVTVDDLYLIPTAEVPVTNLYRDVILREEQLPVKNCAYTPCFRR
jgi:seryl-tRNA synthetase